MDGSYNSYNTGNIVQPNKNTGIGAITGNGWSSVGGGKYSLNSSYSYYLKNSTVNNNLNAIYTRYEGSSNYQLTGNYMLGYFNSFADITITPTNGTYEFDEYKNMTILQKLNKWVTDNQDANNTYSTWKMSSDGTHPVFSWQ